MLRIISRYIKGYRKNTINVIIGITLSVTLMFSLIQMGDSILMKFKDCVLQTNPMDLEIKDINQSQTNALEDSVKKNRFSHEVKHYLSSMNYGHTLLTNNLRGNFVGVRGDIDEFYGFIFIEGKMFNKDYEVVLEKSFIDNLDKPCKVGEKIALSINYNGANTVEKLFIVSGIIENMTGIIGSSNIFTTYNTYLEIEKDTGFKFDNKNRKMGFIADKYSYDNDIVYDLQDDIVNALGYKNIKATNIKEINEEDKAKLLETSIFIEQHLSVNERKAYLYESDKGDFKVLGNSVKWLTVIIAICMIIFIYNTINISFIQKIKQYGAMRCIGLSKGQLIKLIAFETLFYSFCGIILGITFGNIINSLMATKIISLMMWGNIKVNISQTIGTYLLVIVITIISVSISMIKIFINIRKLTPIKALNYTEDSGYKCNKYKEIKVDRKNNFVSSLAKRNLKRNKGKSRTLIITLTISVILLTVILNVLFLVRTQEKLYDKSDIANYEVNLDVLGIINKDDKYLYDSDIKLIRENKDIESVYGQGQLLDFSCEELQGDITHINKKSQKENKQTLIVSGVIVYDDQLFEKLLYNNNNLKGLDYKNNDIAILSTSPGVTSNLTKVRLKDTKNKKECEVSIDSIINNASFVSGLMLNNLEHSYLIINKNMLRNKLEIDKYGYTSLLIKSKGNVDGNYIKNDILKGFKITINDLKNVNNTMEKQLLGGIILASYIVIVVLMLSFLIIKNTVKANIISRFKENGILRAIGLEKKYLCKIACREQLKLSIKAVAIGSCISIFINLNLLKALETKGRISVMAYIIVALLIIGISVLIVKLTMKKSMKYKIIEMIREE